MCTQIHSYAGISCETYNKQLSNKSFAPYSFCVQHLSTVHCSWINDSNRTVSALNYYTCLGMPLTIN